MVTIDSTIAPSLQDKSTCPSSQPAKRKYRRRRSGRHRSAAAATNDADSKAAAAAALRAQADAATTDVIAMKDRHTSMESGPAADALLADINALDSYAASHFDKADALDAKAATLRTVASRLAAAERHALDASAATATSSPTAAVDPPALNFTSDPTTNTAATAATATPSLKSTAGPAANTTAAAATAESSKTGRKCNAAIELAAAAKTGRRCSTAIETAAAAKTGRCYDAVIDYWRLTSDGAIHGQIRPSSLTSSRGACTSESYRTSPLVDIIPPRHGSLHHRLSSTKSAACGSIVITSTGSKYLLGIPLSGAAESNASPANLARSNVRPR